LVHLTDRDFSDGIEDLTGGLATFYRSEDIVDRDKFWDEGFAKVNKSYLWGCGTFAVNEQDKRGIEGGHAYTILEAETIPDGTRLVKVRNPWGKSEWEGDWGDRSPKWTDELKKLLKHEDKDDGIFWISYEDLLRNYHCLHRTRIFDASWTVAQSWTNFTVPLLTSDTYESTFKVTLSKAATTAIVLSQLDERYFRGLEGQYDFGLSFRLHKLNDDDYLYRCHHRYFSDRSVNLEVDLEAGVYEVRLQITGDRCPERPKIEDVVRINWKDSRKKLLQICRSYDLAHAKVAVPEPQPKAMEAKAEAEAEDVTKDPAAEKSNVDASLEAESSDLTSSSVEVSTPESASGAAVAGSVVEADPGSKPEEAAKGSTDTENPTSATKPETNESKLITEDVKEESQVMTMPQDHETDLNPNSAEAEMTGEPEPKPEAGGEGEESATQRATESKDSTPDDATPQTSKKPPPSSPPSPSSSPPNPNNKYAGRRTSTDLPQSPTIKSSQAADSQKDILPPKPDKDNNDVDPPNPPKPPKDPDGDDDKDKDREKDIKKDDDGDKDAKKKTKAEEEEKEEDTKPDELFNSVCTVGLRVYCKDAEARIEIIRPSTALLRDKQFTSSREKRLDADDPAKS
jgi:Calpain family cysteine protease